MSLGIGKDDIFLSFVHKMWGKKPKHSLFQPYPNILVVKHPSWLQRHAGEQVSSSSRLLTQFKDVFENSHGKRDTAGQEEVRHQN